MLAKAGVEGRLTTRGNASNFKGGYKEIVQGVNETLDAVIKPVQDGARVLEIMVKEAVAATASAANQISSTQKKWQQVHRNNLHKQQKLQVQLNK
jgi:hypothetical protein